MRDPASAFREKHLTGSPETLKRKEKSITESFKYQPLRPDEQMLGFTVSQVVITDSEIVAQVAEFHDSGERCSCVVITNKRGDFEDGYVADEVAICDHFPFAEVREAISSYDPTNSISLILVRGHDVSVSIVGRSF